jgi:hypothetical protein
MGKERNRMTLHPDDIIAILSSGALGKIFIELADSMPTPPPSAGYLWRWTYNFLQSLASNSAKKLPPLSQTGNSVTSPPNGASHT